MKRLRALALASLMVTIGGAARAADPHVLELRALSAPPPTTIAPAPSGAKARQVRLAKVLIHPHDGEPWALVYNSFMITGEDAPRPPPDKLLTWDSGRIDGRMDSFGQAFEGELRKAGYAAEAQDVLFGETGSSDLQVGVLIDDMKGRFCRNCPNIFQRDKISGVVMMNARWEIYSAVRGQVVARVTTHGGGTWRQPNGDSVMPVVLEAFRENVRQLVNSDDFRKVVLAPAAETSAPAMTPAPSRPISLPAAGGNHSLATAAQGVALVFAGDGMGTAFLVSPDGYLITNHHVVGDAAAVRVRWADRTETVGQVVRSDVRRDVALIKVAEAHGRKPLPLRLTGAEVGESVFAIGTPLETSFQNTVTKGIVSATRTLDGQSYIQSDVAVDHGNSGGPLVDETGSVIGITELGYAPDGVSHNLNFFIPIGSALNSLQLKVSAAPLAPAARKRVASVRR